MRTYTEDEKVEATACRLKHGDVVFFTVSHDDDGEYMTAHCVVCGTLRTDYCMPVNE